MFYYISEDLKKKNEVTSFWITDLQELIKLSFLKIYYSLPKPKSTSQVLHFAISKQFLTKHNMLMPLILHYVSDGNLRI